MDIFSKTARDIIEVLDDKTMSKSEVYALLHKKNSRCSWSHIAKIIEWLSGKEVNYKGVNKFEKVEVPLLEIKKGPDKRSLAVSLTKEGKNFLKILKEAKKYANK